jgi:hypothetical protein
MIVAEEAIVAFNILNKSTKLVYRHIPLYRPKPKKIMSLKGTMNGITDIKLAHACGGI